MRCVEPSIRASLDQQKASAQQDEKSEPGRYSEPQQWGGDGAVKRPSAPGSENNPLLEDLVERIQQTEKEQA